MSVNVTISIEGQVGSGKTITRKIITEALESKGLKIDLITVDGKKEVISVSGKFNYEKA